MARGIDTAAAVLPIRKQDSNLPDAGRLVIALRQIGYSLEQAIADLVDNSINAGAGHVLIRFLHDGEHIRALAIADDGNGMNDAELLDAMRFGSHEKNDPATLGKFGMGMKLASLSHAQTMTVFSRASGRSSARRWTIEGISTGWWCERLRSDAAATMLDRKWGIMDLSVSGTVVLWEEIDRLPSHRSGFRYTLGALERRLRLHLGLCFHRFIESGKLRIHLDQLLVNREGQGLQAEISPLNPFGYEESGATGYPKCMKVELTAIGELSLEAHIWPAHSELPEYKLGRRTAARQGLYFYRNDRLIQTGGWNGLVQDETEPHSSLARVAIDLPIEYDDWFGINVQKSSVLVPPVFSEVLTAESSDGETFDEYRRKSIEVYRNANREVRSTAPIVTRGLPKAALRSIRSLHGSSDAAEKGFSVVWRKLPHEEFFRLEKDKDRLVVNSCYRFCNGSSGSSDVLKLLLAMMMRYDFSSKQNRRRERELEALNAMLVSISSNQTQ